MSDTVPAIPPAPLELVQYPVVRQLSLADTKLIEAIKHPLRYRQEGGTIGEGIPGHVLRRILAVWVRAHAEGELGPSQVRVAETAKAILDGLEDLAIDVLIDEATGYQKRRAHTEPASAVEGSVGCAAQLGEWRAGACRGSVAGTDG